MSVKESKGFGAIDSETFKWVMMEWTPKIKGSKKKGLDYGRTLSLLEALASLGGFLLSKGGGGFDDGQYQAVWVGMRLISCVQG